MDARELFVDTLAYIPPARALEGLSTEDAERRVPGVNHSIAEIVSHMTFWQDWFCNRCEGRAALVPTSAALGWPAVAAGSWPRIQEQFLAGVRRAVALGGSGQFDAPISPPIEFPPLANYRRLDAMVHMAMHNSHHVGQIITVRQMMGLWPPPAGSFTW